MPNFRRTRSNCRSFIGHDVFAVNQHLARIRLQQADEMLEQNAFAAAAAPDDDDRFAVFNPKTHAVQNRVSRRNSFQIADFNHNSPTSLPMTSVRKKFAIRIVMDEYTTASVVARPTPSAPSPHVMPL